ncbi:CPBP family intramembrane glutamic endopeptidase [Oceanobacillus neutriphilus]|uniref:Abortive infection protein n=1 Tax=Oceanobacillus neutriphilus TaxID=531815 RepID=A0ABQ2P2W3_9BACI|nr:CPBP family intramembrane glutamic endopeptidase [Oceanobacillus neutriphilus]GGP16911.1 abortive infection protein [Oceanobacillus neutriphilus]
MGKWRIKLVLLFAILNTIGIFAIIPYQITLMGGQSASGDIPNSLIVMINSTVQIVYMFVMILIGLRLQNRTGLNAPVLNGIVYPETRIHISKKWLTSSIVVALIGSLITILLDLFVFSPLMEAPMGQSSSPNWWQGLLASIYGGFTEEIMLRLFGMTLIVWLLAWITKKQKGDIPHSFYYIAIFLAAILFGLGHLPAAAQVFGGLSAVIVTRTLVLNGLLGLWFGYLYWKRGLEYAIIAHISADIFLHVLIVPILN